MIFGTMMFSVFNIWLDIVQMVIFQPWLIVKVAFLWLAMSFAASYIFFLVTHKSNVLHVRKALAIEIVKSCGFSFLLATALMALYEFVLYNLKYSKFFAANQAMIEHMSFATQEGLLLYHRLCFLMVILSGIFASHYVGAMLDQWYEEHISNRYGWFIMTVTLVCWGFLWIIRYVV